MGWDGYDVAYISEAYLSITSFDHIIDAIVGEEGGGDRVQEGQGDWVTRPRQRKTFFSEIMMLSIALQHVMCICFCKNIIIFTCTGF